ncbi:gliding motility-associated ABC transporter permease subunit GldF, partial [Crocinitomicaceae bacterium]|nr:gliding motility-associated ABC transporter permease subunit GldF [Crocinitomicaceae bacterium]
GATITSYLGLILVGACLVSVGIFASSITDSQIVSFILAMFLSWFMFMGLDLLAVFSQFGGLDLVLRNMGIMEHYDSIQRGVLDTRDLIYFVSFAAVFLLSTKLVLQSRKW